MKKVLVCCLILAALSAGLAAEKLFTLADLSKPYRLLVGEKRIYVGEFPRILMFDRKTGASLGAFGTEGEGPGEFKGFFTLVISGDELLVNSRGKVAWFTMDGAYIKEERINPRRARNLIPLGENRWIAQGFTAVEGERFLSVNLLDGRGQKLKELGRQSMGMRGDKLYILNGECIYKVHGSAAYLVTGRDLVIHVVDGEGNESHTFKPNYPPYPFTGKHRDEVLETFRTNPHTRERFPMLKDRMVFPESWPAILDIFPQDDAVHVLTYRRGKDGNEVISLNMDGSVKKRGMTPVMFRNIMRPYPMDVRDGNLHQLVENEEEEWELHSWPL